MMHYQKLDKKSALSNIHFGICLICIELLINTLPVNELFRLKVK